MRAEPGSPPVEFPVFCEAVRTWVRDGVCLDPALAALANLVEGPALAEEELARLVSDATDTHAALGADALLGLVAWSRTGRLR
ncbi:MAG: hypothetical protein M3069_16580 [Chloroflexota bacterium]|nr:hypothetical protein [Chloroflexota bacterium]